MSRVTKSSGLIAWGRGEDGQIDASSRDKGEQLFTIIREGIDGTKNPSTPSATSTINPQTSTQDKLTKLASLKVQGIISEGEFTQLKQDLLKKIQAW